MLKETIKIVNPIPTQNVSTGEELIISGQSSDNTLKNCSVSLIVNDVRPYQYAVASGAGGITDFSQWKFVLHTNYTHIIEGENKITAKLRHLHLHAGIAYLSMEFLITVMKKCYLLQQVSTARYTHYEFI